MQNPASFIIAVGFACFAIWLVAARLTKIAVELRCALIIYALFWLLCPTILAVFIERSFTAGLLIDSATFNRYAAIESAAFSMAIVVFWMQSRYLLKPGPEKFRIEGGEGVAKFVLIGGVVLSLLSAQFIDVGESYHERNTFTVLQDSTLLFRFSGVLAYFQGLVIGVAAACVFHRGRHSLSRPYVILGGISIVLMIGSILLEGGRIGILLGIFFFAIELIRRARMRLGAKRLMLVSAIFSVVVIGVLSYITNVRGDVDIRMEEVAQGATHSLQDRPFDEIATEILNHALYKFDSFSAGAILVDVGGVGAAGFAPYEGAFLALVPRLILEDKPIPGSIDGTTRGHPSRLVVTLSGTVSDIQNVGVSPAAITIWQMGYGGIVLLVLANVFTWIVADRCLRGESLLLRGIGFTLLGIPAFNSIFSSPDVIVMQLQRVLILGLLVYVSVKVSGVRVTKE